MARFQYGTLITRISGSIGGTNFRLFRGMPVISNKSQGYSRSKLLSNSHLANIAWIRRQWNTLTLSEQDDWNHLSSGYSFPNKFGVMVTLTGQQFYNKINTNSMVTGEYNKLSTGVDLYIDSPSLDSITCDSTHPELTLSFVHVSHMNFYLFQADINLKAKRAPVFNRKKIIAVTKEDASFTVDIWSEVVAQYGLPQVGTLIRVYWCTQSISGLRGPWNVAETEVL